THNKLSAGGDVLGGRPTVLWALALEGLGEAERDELHALVGQASGLPQQRAGASGSQDGSLAAAAFHRVRSLYEKAGVFEKAERLVEKYRQRAEAVADAIQPDDLRRLFYYLVDTVLDRPSGDATPQLQIISPASLTAAS